MLSALISTKQCANYSKYFTTFQQEYRISRTLLRSCLCRNTLGPGLEDRRVRPSAEDDRSRVGRALPFLCLLLVMSICTPGYVLLENVTDLFTNHNFSSTLKLMVQENRYAVQFETWNAAEFVPQNRSRCIAVLQDMCKYVQCPFPIRA